jgi:hypothetical protein
MCGRISLDGGLRITERDVRLGEIDVPGELVDATRDRRLVVFAGAGVSMGPPANLPSFAKLVEQVTAGSGQTPTDMETHDRFLGRLAHRGIQVHQRAVARLTSPNAHPTTLHKDLLRLFGGPDEARIVTTNFDLLFEAAAQEVWGKSIDVYKAPALPLGRGFSGLVHVHGALPQASSIILTDSDFGRAYLTEGWARRFLVDLFSTFTVLFVGYSHEDIVLQYLARALPSGEQGRRFALDRNAPEAKRWELLGINLIPYEMPSEHDYSYLYDGIHKLADFCRRNVLDWKHEINELAQRLPPIDVEYADMFRHALGDTVLTRFFVESSSRIEWLHWLDENRILAPLFDSGALDERSQLLANWIAERFAVQHAVQVFLLLGRHRLSINPEFWWRLGRQLASNESTELSDDDLARWVSLLLHAAPRNWDHDFVLQWLSERCARRGLYHSAIQLFEMLITERILISPPVAWPNEQETPEQARPRLQISLAEQWTVNEVWVKCLKPHLATLADSALSVAVTRLQARYALYKQWNSTNSQWDSDSYRRTAIEPHEQDKHPKAVDVIIDVARDAIEWIARQRPKDLSTWRDRLRASDAPLLRRLAVHACRCDENLSADQKTCWALDCDLEDSWIRHEMFALLRDCYRHTSEDHRVRILEAVNRIESQGRADQLGEQQSAIEKLQWLHWISEADPVCALASTALTNLKSAFPEIGVREHPDLTHWIGDATWVGTRSPWTVDELLARNPNDWCHELITFKSESFDGPDRDGLSDAIRDASKQKAQWGLGLAQALSVSGAWETDIWRALLRSWSEWPDDLDAATKIMHWIGHSELHGSHARDIAQLLHALVKDGGRSYSDKLLKTSNEVAKALWPGIERTDVVLEQEDWLQTAINETGGIVAEYWVNSLSIFLNKGDSLAERSLRGDYREALGQMARDESMAGFCARTILVSQFAFLLGVDEKWVREHLVSYFTDSSTLRFQHVWHGLLWSRLNHATLNLLAPAIFAALPRMDRELLSRRDRFIEFYISAIVWHAENPLDEWIPRFFENVSNDARTSFALHMEAVLRGCDPEKQREIWNKWLASYWQGRIEGSPVPLSGGEIEHMLAWTVRLPVMFSEAVAAAIRMPYAQVEHGHLIYELKDNPLTDRYPNDVSELLSFLLDCSGPQWILHGIDELLRKLGQQSLLPENRRALIEKLTARGIDTSSLT